MMIKSRKILLLILLLLITSVCLIGCEKGEETTDETEKQIPYDDTEIRQAFANAIIRSDAIMGDSVEYSVSASSSNSTQAAYSERVKIVIDEEGVPNISMMSSSVSMMGYSSRYFYNGYLCTAVSPLHYNVSKVSLDDFMEEFLPYTPTNIEDMSDYLTFTKNSENNKTTYLANIKEDGIKALLDVAGIGASHSFEKATISFKFDDVTDVLDEISMLVIISTNDKAQIALSTDKITVSSTATVVAYGKQVSITLPDAALFAIDKYSKENSENKRSFNNPILTLEGLYTVDYKDSPDGVFTYWQASGHAMYAGVYDEAGGTVAYMTDNQNICIFDIENKILKKKYTLYENYFAAFDYDGQNLAYVTTSGYCSVYNLDSEALLYHGEFMIYAQSFALHEDKIFYFWSDTANSIGVIDIKSGSKSTISDIDDNNNLRLRIDRSRGILYARSYTTIYAISPVTETIIASYECDYSEMGLKKYEYDISDFIFDLALGLPLDDTNVKPPKTYPPVSYNVYTESMPFPSARYAMIYNSGGAKNRYYILDRKIGDYICSFDFPRAQFYKTGESTFIGIGVYDGSIVYIDLSKEIDPNDYIIPLAKDTVEATEITDENIHIFMKSLVYTHTASDGKYLYAAGMGYVYTFDVKTFSIKKFVDTGIPAVDKMALSGGKLIICGGDICRVFDTESWTVGEYIIPKNPLFVTIYEDKLIVVNRETYRIYESRNMYDEKPLPAYSESVYVHDGKIYCYILDSGLWNGQGGFHCADVATGAFEKKREMFSIFPSGTIRGVSHDGKYIICEYKMSIVFYQWVTPICRYDIETGKFLPHSDYDADPLAMRDEYENVKYTGIYTRYRDDGYAVFDVCHDSILYTAIYDVQKQEIVAELVDTGDEVFRIGNAFVWTGYHGVIKAYYI